MIPRSTGLELTRRINNKYVIKHLIKQYNNKKGKWKN
jgi:hypothetical protein